MQDVSYWKERPATDPHMDWPYTTTDWLQGYWESRRHPHREVLIEELKKLDWQTLLEVGANVGPNLQRIHEEFPDRALLGVEPNQDAVELGRRLLPGAVELKQGELGNLYIEPRDVVLADAVLLYVQPERIQAVMDEVARLTKKAVILVERFAESETGEVTSHVWGRNYTKLLEKRGFHVKPTKITPEMWPTSVGWQTFGYFFVATR